MPIFEYICKKCWHRFEAIVRNGAKTECPRCHGTRLEQQLSVFAVAGGEKRGGFADSEPSGSPCGACGDPRGAGACSLDD